PAGRPLSNRRLSHARRNQPSSSSGRPDLACRRASAIESPRISRANISAARRCRWRIARARLCAWLSASIETGGTWFSNLCDRVAGEASQPTLQEPPCTRAVKRRLHGRKILRRPDTKVSLCDAEIHGGSVPRPAKRRTRMKKRQGGEGFERGRPATGVGRRGSERGTTPHRRHPLGLPGRGRLAGILPPPFT